MLEEPGNTTENRIAASYVSEPIQLRLSKLLSLDMPRSHPCGSFGSVISIIIIPANDTALGSEHSTVEKEVSVPVKTVVGLVQFWYS